MKPLKALRAVLFLTMALSSIAVSQTVRFEINLPSYDVIYLSDFVDIRNVQLSDNIPDMSIAMYVDPPQTINVWMEYQADIQLRGENRELLARGYTDDFELATTRRLSSKDLSGSGAQGIRTHTLEKASQALQDKLTDYVQRFPTAPVGQYFFKVTVYAAPYPSRTPLGEIEKVITVRNASESEVNITLISPEQGATIPTPFPTFSWSSEKPEVTLFVYEKLPIHQSPEEAVTGIPYLQRNITGVTSFTYPADADRRLEIGKSYYWFLTTNVLTSRGDLTRQSEIRLFRILPGGGVSNPLLVALLSMGGDVASQLARLVEEGWLPSDATIDGSPAGPGDVNALLQRLARENAEVKLSVE